MENYNNEIKRNTFKVFISASYLYVRIPYVDIRDAYTKNLNFQFIVEVTYRVLDLIKI